MGEDRPIQCSPVKNGQLQIDHQFEEILSRCTSSGHEEVLSVLNNDLLFHIESVPKYLSSAKGLVIQLVSKDKSNSIIINNGEKKLSCSTPVRTPKVSAIPDLDTTGSPLRTKFLFEIEDEVLGSPLSAECFLQAKQKPKVYHGVPIQVARYLLSKMQKLLTDTPIYVACNGCDPQQTVMMGIKKESTGFSTETATVGGPHLGIDSLPSIDDLSSHFYLLNCRLNTSAEAVYEIMSPDEGGSSVALQSSWLRPLSVLSSPALNASILAEVLIDCTDPRSAAVSLHQELTSLQKMVEGLHSGEVVWTGRADNGSVSQDLHKLFDGKNEKNVEAFSLDGIIEGKFFKVRQNTDFTDQLWDILRRSESYSDLQNGLQTTFEEIASGNIRPQIYIRNTTQVAEAARDLMKTGTFPDLKGRRPLQMLVEMGLEKIKRDYVTIFQVGELATSEQLFPFVDWRASDMAFEACLAALTKMHMGVQVAVTLRKFLKLPSVPLAECVTQALATLEQKLETQFRFNVQTNVVAPVLEGAIASIWKLNLCSEGKSLSFSIHRDVPHLNATDTPTSPPNENSEELKLYTLAVQTTLHKIKF